MKRVLAIVFLIAVFLAAWWLFFNVDVSGKKSADDTQEAIAVKEHTDVFNAAINKTVDAYMELSEAFVNADTSGARQKAAHLAEVAGQVPLDGLEKAQIKGAAEQQISDLQANAEAIVEGNDLTEMRRSFYMLSENIYPFLKTIGYEGEKLYWQSCPMAFNGDETAYWLSGTSKVMNPYLGKNHPKYQNTMLHCGETVDSIYLSQQ